VSSVKTPMLAALALLAFVPWILFVFVSPKEPRQASTTTAAVSGKFVNGITRLSFDLLNEVLKYNLYLGPGNSF